MKLTVAAFATAFACLLAAAQLQYGPQWKADAAVRAAIAHGDLAHAGEIAVTAKHWKWIAKARSAQIEALHSPPDLPRLTLAGKRDRNAADESDGI
jgi:hypothetical protein